MPLKAFHLNCKDMTRFEINVELYKINTTKNKIKLKNKCFQDFIKFVEKCFGEI